MNRWIVISIFAATFVLGFLLWPHVRRASGASQGDGSGDRAPIASEPSSRPKSDQRPVRAVIPRVVKQTAVQPVVRNSATSTTPVETDVSPEGGVDPNIPLTAEGISAVTDKMRPSIAACVDEWTSETPDIHGRVVLAFQIGPDGIQDAWVMEHQDVPTGVLGCFSSAVYEQRWPSSPEGVEVTLPFEVDAGLDDDGTPTKLLDRR